MQRTHAFATAPSGAFCQQASLGTAATVEEGQGCTRVKSHSQGLPICGDALVDGAVGLVLDIWPRALISCMQCLQPRRLASWCLWNKSLRHRGELRRPGESPGYCDFQQVPGALALVKTSTCCLCYCSWARHQGINAKICHQLLHLGRGFFFLTSF